ncbi:hypothetical protein [Chondromyces apiculatus]|uniref:Uncharacterized protein n=1 Tax=Chondromyces apiculatus DSM 436 TaxID=1192034 RepID=A0A017TDQ4_9BACT|nr:hypothetical protein [Chondromyces apiculatus]EYF06940.1 Hypothetical protein CAP_1198 [Chondromyces apiculatus DSM 436]
MKSIALGTASLLLGLAALTGACTSLLGDFELEGAGGSSGTTSSISAGGAGQGGDAGSGAGVPACETVCEQGLGDCDTCDGTCETLLVGADANNCGACGKTCEDSLCVVGVCQPVLVADMQTDEPVSLAVDATHLYWLNQGDLGGATGTVARRRLDLTDDVAELVNEQGAPSTLVVHGEHLYWTNRNPSDYGYLVRMPLAGGETLALAQGQSLVGLATDGTALFWTDQYDDSVGSKLLPGVPGASQPIATGQGKPGGIAVDANHVYWVNLDAGEVVRADKDGMSRTTLAVQQQGLRAIAVDDRYVYWTYVSSGGPQDSGGIMRKALEGDGNPEPLGESAVPREIVSDGERVYWTDASASSLFWVPREGDPSMQQEVVTDSPTQAVTVDAKRVYWSTNNSIYKMVK